MRQKIEKGAQYWKREEYKVSFNGYNGLMVTDHIFFLLQIKINIIHMFGLCYRIGSALFYLHHLPFASAVQD